MVDHLGNVPLHFSFDLVEVLDQGNYEVVAHVQQFQGQLLLGDFLAVEYVIQHFLVQIR